MGIRDAAIDYMRRRKYFSYYDLNMVIAKDTTADETFTEGEILGGPKLPDDIIQVEIADYGISGLQIAAADDDDGQTIYGYTRMPYDLDPRWPVGFRINWTQSAAVTVGTTFKLFVGVDKKDAVIQAEDATQLVAALDTLIAESNAGGANYNQWTSRGIRDDIGLTLEEIADGALLRINVEADVIDATTTVVLLLGVEMDYVPLMTQGVGSEIDRPLLYTGKNS